MYLNRVVTVLTVIVGIIGAALPAIANLDTTSTAGILGGLGAIVVPVVVWLQGWQKAEAREHEALAWSQSDQAEGVVTAPGGGVTPPQED
jgi:hypothetical protein